MPPFIDPSLSAELPNVAEPVASQQPAQRYPLDRLAEDLKSMVQQNAPQEDLDTYIRERGYTPQEAAAHINQPSALSKAWNAARSVGSSVVETVVGKHDPRYADVPGFSMQGISDHDVFTGINRAKLVTYDDKSYGDIIKKKLGDRFISSEEDENKYQIITYRGDDGKVYRTYLNKPGLDTSDVDRAIAGSIPFMIGSGLGGMATKGLGILARVATQGVTAGGVSLAADSVAQSMGSEQPHDLVRAGITAGFGSAFEGMAPAAKAVWQKIVTQPSYVSNGKLTDKGRQVASEMGLDPDQLNEKFAAVFARDLSRGADEAEIATKARAGEFGIASTKGQRTKDPAQLGLEEEMRRSLMGDRARQTMSEFDKSQQQQIEAAVYDKIGNRLTPQPPGREPATLGQNIKEGAQRAAGAMDAAEAAAWRETSAIFPQEEGLALLAPRIAQEFKDRQVWPKTNLGAQPQTNAMLDILEGYVKGKLDEGTIPLIGKGPSNIFIDDMRRYLLNLYKGSERGSFDEMGARAVYDGFNKWIDDLVAANLLVGKPEAAAALKAARGFTKEMKDLLEPGGASSPASRRLMSVLGDANTPEEVLTSLFGAGAPTSSIQSGQRQAMANLKVLLNENGEQEVWNSVRFAYWARLAQNSKGEVLSPKLLQNNIDKAFHNQKSIMDILYNKEEQALMRRLSTALDDVTYTPPNPSGTSYELERMRQREGKSAMKTILQTQAQRETFSKHNTIMARVYKILAQKFPLSVMGSKEGAGSKLAERAIGQGVTEELSPSLGGIGAAIGAQVAD